MATHKNRTALQKKNTGKPETADSISSIQAVATSASTPLVFISHDARDAELAEAFSKLLKSVSAGMIKTFRSSDKTGSEGIDFGEEWYRRLMTQLQATSDVVCLFTERSLDRPWILFEAGVAKGKLNTPVLGVALGVPLSSVTAGPFYQFMNMDDSEPDLTKLVNQLAKKVPNLELDGDVVRAQVAAFKKTEADILKSLSVSGAKIETAEVSESAVAKLSEEMKALPSRVAERLLEGGDLLGRRRIRRFHPRMLEELLHTASDPGDPVGILLAASIVRDELPWLYELATEAYRAVRDGAPAGIERAIVRVRRISERFLQGPFMEEFGFPSRESHMIAVEFPRMLERMLVYTLDARKMRSGKSRARKEAAPEEASD